LVLGFEFRAFTLAEQMLYHLSHQNFFIRGKVKPSFLLSSPLISNDLVVSVSSLPGRLLLL
jgi:hypothetical protein